MATQSVHVAMLRRGSLLAERVRSLPPHRLETLAYLALALGTSWAIALAAPSSPAVVLAALVPGTAALLLTRAHGPGVRRRLGLDRLGWPDAYLIAIWVPVLFVAVRITATVTLGNGRLDDDVGGLHPASGDYPVGGVVLQVVAAILVAPLANMLLMLGSELGWRAYLLPRLLPLGPRQAVALTSLAWGLWLAPLMLDPARSLPGGSNERWMIEAGAYLVWCALVGEILGWLYLRTRSVWAPALFTGALAATSSLPGLVLRDVMPDAAGTFGPAALVAPAIVVLVLRLGSGGEIEPVGRAGLVSRPRASTP